MSDNRESDDNVIKSTHSTQKALPCPKQAIKLLSKDKSIDVTDDSDTDHDEELTITPSPTPINNSIEPAPRNSHKPDAQATNSLRLDVNIKQINMLLLGESGVGKSTFINSFANYMKHQNFEAVEENNLTVLIPARFHIFDKDLQNHLVVLGTQDVNEYLADGAATTQDVKTYVFSVKIDDVRYEFRLIDTPGMGDPQGIAQDNKNCDLVLNYIGRMEKIHAICLLLKPTNSRLDLFLNYCINQILSRLDKSATDNIAFLFTNTRGQNYTPGETYTSLEVLVKKIKDTNNVHIPLSNDNVFCFDNEAFRFLAAIKQGVEFKEGILEANIESWKYSYKEVYRLLSYIVQLKPHDTKKTVSINHARKMVLQLTQPLAEIIQLIGDNIYELEQHSQQLLMDNETLDQLKKKLYMSVVDLRIKELSQPVTVCTAVKCSIVYKVTNKNKYHYKQRCHNPCYLNDVPAEIVGDPKLLNCWAKKRKQSCRVRGCRFSTHMHIYYETETFDNKIIDYNVMANISTKEEATREKEKLINYVLDRKERLQKEHDYIIKCVALFANFLQQNAITPMNDFVEEYIKCLITREESLGPNAEMRNLDYLKRLLAQYEGEKKALEEALKYEAASMNSNLSNSPLAIERKIRDLFVLPHFGSKIKYLYDLHKIGGLSEHRQTEHVVKEQYQLSIVGNIKETVSSVTRNLYKKMTASTSHKGKTRYGSRKDPCLEIENRQNHEYVDEPYYSDDLPYNICSNSHGVCRDNYDDDERKNFVPSNHKKYFQPIDREECRTNYGSRKDPCFEIENRQYREYVDEPYYSDGLPYSKRSNSHGVCRDYYYDNERNNYIHSNHKKHFQPIDREEFRTRYGSRKSPCLKRKNRRYHEYVDWPYFSDGLPYSIRPNSYGVCRDYHHDNERKNYIHSNYKKYFQPIDREECRTRYGSRKDPCLDIENRRHYEYVDGPYYSDGLPYSIRSNSHGVCRDYYHDNERKNYIHSNHKNYFQPIDREEYMHIKRHFQDESAQNKSIQKPQNWKALKNNQDHPVVTSTVALKNHSKNKLSINSEFKKKKKKTETAANVTKNNQKRRKNQKKAIKRKQKKKNKF